VNPRYVRYMRCLRTLSKSAATGCSRDSLRPQPDIQYPITNRCRVKSAVSSTTVAMGAVGRFGAWVAPRCRRPGARPAAGRKSVDSSRSTATRAHDSSAARGDAMTFTARRLRPRPSPRFGEACSCLAPAPCGSRRSVIVATCLAWSVEGAFDPLIAAIALAAAVLMQLSPTCRTTSATHCAAARRASGSGCRGPPPTAGCRWRR